MMSESVSLVLSLFGVPSTGVYKFTHTNTFDATKAIYLAGGAAVGCDVNINADATDVILTTNGSAGTGSNTVLSINKNQTLIRNCGNWIHLVPTLLFQGVSLYCQIVSYVLAQIVRFDL